MQDTASSSVIEKWLASSHFAGANADYIEHLYENYLDNPNSIDEQWRLVFDALPQVSTTEERSHTQIQAYFKALALDSQRNSFSATDPYTDSKQVKVLQLINAYRFRGHQHAQLDPLGLSAQERVPDLDPSFHTLDANDLEKSFNVGSYAIGKENMVLADLIKSLQKTYCGTVAVEYMHITNTDEKRWIQQRLESVEAHPRFSIEEKTRFLKNLTAAEGLEKYLGAKFPGAKRFSLEGGDSMISMIKELIRHAGECGTKEMVMGMAHRGRLNMLVNVLGKAPNELFDEFAGKHGESWGSGDVKYHQGFSSEFNTPAGDVHLSLAFNPSHLEIVNPVVMGSVRARQDRRDDKEGTKVLPVTIHGDSAIAGQGVVQETFNMSQARGYKVGGTVRIVINNQVGFTTSNPYDTRSTQYCTDIGKTVQAPIFHVNGDDPEAVTFVTKLALDYRNRFHRDVLIDLVCYRRHGHNEADEPNATQPLMYQKIKKQPTARKLYADQLIAEGSIKAEDATSFVNGYRDMLDQGDNVVEEWRPMADYSIHWRSYLNHEWDMKYNPSLAMDKLHDLGKSISSYPEQHILNARVKKIYDDRLLMAKGEKAIDWGFAENLAYATVLVDGTDIRFTGQDVGRGTFFHRHAVLHNQTDATTYVPLKNLSDNQGHFAIFDSVLSEEAVLAFEYGYSSAEPKGLTIWEAQFGDFANGAQVVIDQFISSGEQKWARMCGLTLFLPHGYEGQGPEHSSARLERYLQLCADHNMQVCVPSTPAQVYHMIRRQVVRPMRRPLIVMSPKSLLRHPQAISSLDELANGSFQNVIGEVADIDKSKVNRIVFCSGKVYYDLLAARRDKELDNVAIFRVEQLYPFPKEDMLQQLADYGHVKEFIWCQEEPLNQGAWFSSQHHFRDVIGHKRTLHYAGREASASPAVGYMSVHMKQQKALVESALGLTE